MNLRNVENEKTENEKKKKSTHSGSNNSELKMRCDTLNGEMYSHYGDRERESHRIEPITMRYVVAYGELWHCTKHAQITHIKKHLLATKR